MLAGEFGNHRPGVVIRSREGIAQFVNGGGFTGGRSTRVTMAASRPRLSTSCKPTCKRTELASIGVRVQEHGCALRIDDGGERGFVPAGNDYNKIRKRERANRGGKKRYRAKGVAPRLAEARVAGLCRRPCAMTRLRQESLRRSWRRVAWEPPIADCQLSIGNHTWGFSNGKEKRNIHHRSTKTRRKDKSNGRPEGCRKTRERGSCVEERPFRAA